MPNTSRNKLQHIRKKQELSGAFWPLTKPQIQELMKTMAHDYPKQERAIRYSRYRNAIKWLWNYLPNIKQLECLSKELRKEFMELIISICNHSDFASIVIYNPNLQIIIDAIKNWKSFDLNDLHNVVKIFGCGKIWSTIPFLEVPLSSFWWFRIWSIVSFKSNSENEYSDKVKEQFDNIGHPVMAVAINYHCVNPFYIDHVWNDLIPWAKISLKWARWTLELDTWRLSVAQELRVNHEPGGHIVWSNLDWDPNSSPHDPGNNIMN